MYGIYVCIVCSKFLPVQGAVARAYYYYEHVGPTVSTRTYTHIEQ